MRRPKNRDMKPRSGKPRRSAPHFLLLNQFFLKKCFATFASSTFRRKNPSSAALRSALPQIMRPREFRRATAPIHDEPSKPGETRPRARKRRSGRQNRTARYSRRPLPGVRLAAIATTSNNRWLSRGAVRPLWLSADESKTRRTEAPRSSHAQATELAPFDDVAPLKGEPDGRHQEAE